jgi:hypothetical protein
LHLSPKAAFFYVATLLGHVVRARIEERKLTAVYPEYEDYRQTTGMFLPKPSRLFALSAPARIAPGTAGERPQPADLAQ